MNKESAQAFLTPTTNGVLVSIKIEVGRQSMSIFSKHLSGYQIMSCSPSELSTLLTTTLDELLTEIPLTKLSETLRQQSKQSFVKLIESCL